MNVRRWGMGLVVALGSFFLIANERNRAADAKLPAVPLSEAEFGRLVDQTRKVIQDALKGKPDDEATEKAQTAATLLAAIAQYSQDEGNGKQRSTVRAVALKVSGAIKDGKLDQARKEAQDLVPNAAGGKAPLAPLPLIDKQVTMSEVMHHFTGKGIGGEAKLDKLAEQANKGALPAKVLTEDVILLALKSAVVGEMLKESKHDKVKKDPKAWVKYSEEMRKYSLELAEATRGKDGVKAYNAINNLNSSCSACHKKFER